MSSTNDDDSREDLRINATGLRIYVEIVPARKQSEDSSTVRYLLASLAILMLLSQCSMES